MNLIQDRWEYGLIRDKLFEAQIFWKRNDKGEFYTVLEVPGYNKNTLKVKVTRDNVFVTSTDGKRSITIGILPEMDLKTVRAIALDGLLTISFKAWPEINVTIE